MPGQTPPIKKYDINIERFMKLFSGRSDCYGYNQICIKSQFTKDIYNDHLQGLRRVGCYPIFNEKFVKFIVVDIDEYDFEKALLFKQKFEHHGLKSYIESSKSKGFHVWTFFDKEIEAVKPRLVVEMFFEELQYKTEIFPKQDSAGESGYGNFIFLPLFGGDVHHGRTCFLDDNTNIIINSAKDLNLIEINRAGIIDEIIEINQLSRVTTVFHERSQGLGLPNAIDGRVIPCILKMKKGVQPGHRDIICYRIAAYYKERGMFKEDIIDMLLQWRIKCGVGEDRKEYSEREVLKTVESVLKSQYKGYGCEDPIVQAYCDKENCPMLAAKELKKQAEEGIITMTFRDEKVMIFKKNNYEFRLSSFNCNKGSQLKCSLTLSRKEGSKYKMLIRDWFDFTSDMKFKRFVKAANDESIQPDLAQLDDLVRTQLEKEEKERIATKKQNYVMTEEEKNEALKKLEKTPHILSEIINLTNGMGVVGEEDLRLMVYLCFTSRITMQPISITVKGEASSGKSYSCQNVMKLIPEEGVKFITKATAQAFYHLEEDGLSHKIIYINENPGKESADYSIRSAQSEGDLSLLIPVKDPLTGEQRTVEKVVRGPAGFLTTTTQVSIFDENETRNFSVFSDDSPDLTRKIGSITVRRAKGEKFIVDPKEINLWKNIQRILNPDFQVIIPYAQEVFLSFPDYPVRIRRDRERFRTLIEVITLLHQFHRNQYKSVDGGMIIESTLVDYFIAKVIAEDILTYTIFELGPSAEELWKRIQEEEQSFDQNSIACQYEDYTFTYKTIAESIGWKKEKVKKWMYILIKNNLIEYADKTEGGKKKESVFKVAKKNTRWSSQSYSFLPRVEDLFNQYPCDKDLFYNPITGMKIDPVNAEIPYGLDE